MGFVSIVDKQKKLDFNLEDELENYLKPFFYKNLSILHQVFNEQSLFVDFPLRFYESSFTSFIDKYFYKPYDCLKNNDDKESIYLLLSETIVNLIRYYYYYYHYYSKRNQFITHFFQYDHNDTADINMNIKRNEQILSLMGYNFIELKDNDNKIPYYQLVKTNQEIELIVSSMDNEDISTEILKYKMLNITEEMKLNIINKIYLYLKPLKKDLSKIYDTIANLMNNGIRHKSPEKINLNIEKYINETDNIYDIIYDLMIEVLYDYLFIDLHKKNKTIIKQIKELNNHND